MKKLIVIAIALISIQGIAQELRKERPNREERSQKMGDYTPEEIATLRTKQMTLHLDLNQSQQKEIYKLSMENVTLRKKHVEEMKAKKANGTMEKPSKEERYKMMNDRLDHQIAIKAKMKSILNTDQFAKWEKAQEKMAHMHKVGMKNKKGHRQDKNPEEQRKI